MNYDSDWDKSHQSRVTSLAVGCPLGSRTLTLVGSLAQPHAP